jgi:hypothetical protein
LLRRINSVKPRAKQIIAIYHVSTNPVYAGLRLWQELLRNTLDASGLRKKRVRKLPVSEWGARIAGNARPRPAQTGSGPVRRAWFLRAASLSTSPFSSTNAASTHGNHPRHEYRAVAGVKQADLVSRSSGLRKVPATLSSMEYEIVVHSS